MSKLTLVRIESALVNLHIANTNLKLAKIEETVRALSAIERLLMEIVEDTAETGSCANHVLAMARAQFEPVESWWSWNQDEEKEEEEEDEWELCRNGHPKKYCTCC